MRLSGVRGLVMIIGTGLRAALKWCIKLIRYMSMMFPGNERIRHKRTLLLVPVFSFMVLRWAWLRRIWRLIMPSDHGPDSRPRGEVESPESVLSVEVETSESLPSGTMEVPVLRSFDVEDTDEYYCMYDSTWEDNPSEETSERKTQHERIHQHTGWSQQSNKFIRFKSAARDMQKYRRDYPEQRSNFSRQQQDDMPNLQFYRGQIPSSPDGVYIEDFHNKWHRKYSKLEEVHSYIQWLFPLQEPGMNYRAKELTKKEIEAFLQDGTAKQGLVTSYKLMLDFYGIELSNDITGEVKRANNWRNRFDNLERNAHNNLRITRILKCLGTLGFSHYQAPLVRFFLEQTLVKGQLYNVKESVLNYFIFAVIDKQERRNLVKYAYAHYEPKHEFVWCPKTIQSIFREETLPDDENKIVLKQDDIDDNTASYQSVSRDVNKDEPRVRSGMAGEVRDLMSLESPNDAQLRHVSIPHDKVCDLSTSYTPRNKGTSQGSKTTAGRNQNTNGDSTHEDLPIRQDPAQSSYGASEIGSAIITPYPSQQPTTDSLKQSDCQPSSGHSERITDDQRKRAADKPTEHKLHKRSKVSDGKTNPDHDERQNKGAADK